MDNKENVTRKTCHIFHLHYQGKLVKENLSRKTCQGKLASVYSRQVFLDKWTCQGKIARVNGALHFFARLTNLKSLYLKIIARTYKQVQVFSNIQ